MLVNLCLGRKRGAEALAGCNLGRDPRVRCGALHNLGGSATCIRVDGPDGTVPGMHEGGDAVADREGGEGGRGTTGRRIALDDRHCFVGGGACGEQCVPDRLVC